MVSDTVLIPVHIGFGCGHREPLLFVLSLHRNDLDMVDTCFN